MHLAWCSYANEAATQNYMQFFLDVKIQESRLQKSDLECLAITLTSSTISSTHATVIFSDISRDNKYEGIARQ